MRSSVLKMSGISALIICRRPFCRPLLSLCHQQGGEIKNVALGIDVRERVFFSDLVGILERVKALGHAIELIFFEAREEVLVRRFSESRRPHPLLPHLPVLEGVRVEKERLSDLRRHADRIIDTSDLTVHELRELLNRQFREEGVPHRLTISLMTFGYKFGVPYDIDLLFDVRFLRNPFFIPDLKPLTGEDSRVRTMCWPIQTPLHSLGNWKASSNFSFHSLSESVVVM